MALVVRGFIALMMAVFFSAAATAADKAIIVLDASGSMWGQIDGKPKLEIARETLRTVLPTIPDSYELGLMAYGHREKGSCEDIELVVPPAAGTSEAIIVAADQMKFLGKTPLSAAVKQAAEAMRYTEDKATVILITDGLETCNMDPCALGTELEQSGIDFTAHVVGFGLTEEEGRQVACLADNTGGKYLPAGDAEELGDALVETVTPPAPAPEPEPNPEPEPEKVEFNIIPTMSLAEGGPDLGEDGQSYAVHKLAADGTRGDYVSMDYNLWKGNIEPGKYMLVAKIGHAETEQPVEVKAEEVARPHFVMNAGTLVIRPRGHEGGEINSGAGVNIKYPGDGDTTYYGETKVILPAGDQKVTVTLGKGVAELTIPLKAGETVEKDVVVGVGRVVANAYYVEGMKVDASGLGVRIVKGQKKIDGTREDVTYGYGPDSEYDLPAGDYVLIAKLDAAEAEAPFTVKVGERVEANVLLRAGVLAISAPGSKVTRVYSTQKDIQGNRKDFWYSYDPNFQVTLPAGDYAIVAERGDADTKTELPATVKAGERTEVTVP